MDDVEAVAFDEAEKLRSPKNPDDDEKVEENDDDPPLGSLPEEPKAAPQPPPLLLLPQAVVVALRCIFCLAGLGGTPSDEEAAGAAPLLLAPLLAATDPNVMEFDRW
jgi:hypothetical protein